MTEERLKSLPNTYHHYYLNIFEQMKKGNMKMNLN